MLGRVTVLTFLMASSAPAEEALFIREPLAFSGAGVRCTFGGTYEQGHDTIDGEIITGPGTGAALDVETDTVPAEIGLSFGVVLRLTGNALFATGQASVTHPPMGAQGTTLQTWPVTLIKGSETYLGYALEDSFEQLPGVWVFQLHIDGMLVMRQAFQVMPPGSVPDVQDICFPPSAS